MRNALCSFRKYTLERYDRQHASPGDRARAINTIFLTITCCIGWRKNNGTPAGHTRFAIWISPTGRISLILILFDGTRRVILFDRRATSLETPYQLWGQSGKCKNVRPNPAKLCQDINSSSSRNIRSASMEARDIRKPFYGAGHGRQFLLYISFSIHLRNNERWVVLSQDTS